MNISAQQTYTENRLWVFRGWRREGGIGSLGLADANYYIYIYIGWLKKQDLTVEHRELYSISCNKL